MPTPCLRYTNVKLTLAGRVRLVLIVLEGTWRPGIRALTALAALAEPVG